RPGGPDGPRRGVLLRPPGQSAGAGLRGEVRLPVPGAVLWLAGEAARHPDVRGAAVELRGLPGQPRPGGQLRGRAALPRPDLAGTLPGHDRSVAAGAGHADALPGAGVRLVGAVLLLRRPQAGAGAAGAEGA